MPMLCYNSLVGAGLCARPTVNVLQEKRAGAEPGPYWEHDAELRIKKEKKG